MHTLTYGLGTWLRLALPAICMAFVASGAGAHGQPGSTPLFTVRQVHAMTPEAAARHLPVRLRGVATTISPYPNAFFMQDATSGISLEGNKPYPVYPGATVEVTGFTDTGRFAPLVKVTGVRVTGKGALPHAPVFNYPELTGGLQDSNWIALRGVIRAAKTKISWGYPVLALTVEVDGNLVEAQIMDRTDAPANLVDSMVTLRGVCTTSFNDKRQFVGIGMIVPSMAYVKVEQAAESDPFARTVTPVRNLLQFHPGAQFRHSVVIEGVVTYQARGQFLYVQDDADGVIVETDLDSPLPLGSRVAVAGFPASGVYSPVLRNAVFRPLGQSHSVSPVLIHGGDFTHTGQFVTVPYDAQLVTMRGELVEVSPRLNETKWLLRDGDSRFVAVLQHPPGAEEVRAIEPGSIVSVTGVFAVQVDELRQPSVFRILLRSPSDIAVVKTASWWSARHFMPVLTVVLMMALGTALWGATLRRTVRQQTQMLRESEERFRNLAQHDALTGLVSRSFLHEQLNEALRHARFSGEKLGLLMVDLDFFKQVNDTLGHHAGDELLRLVADRLRAAVRKTDTVARMGGDEFIVLLDNLSSLIEAEEIGAKVVASISAPAEIAGRPMPISASVGVCLYPDGGRDCDTLLQNVDTAMYKAKATGRNSCAVYTPVSKERKQGGYAVLHPVRS